MTIRGPSTQPGKGCASSIPRQRHVISKWDLAFSWSMAALFLVAATWPLYYSEPFPLPGLAEFSMLTIADRNLQVVTIVASAICLSAKSWHSRDNFLMFQGGTFALSIVGFLDIGVPFGATLLGFSNIARRASNVQD